MPRSGPFRPGKGQGGLGVTRYLRSDFEVLVIWVVVTTPPLLQRDDRSFAARLGPAGLWCRS